MIRGADACVAKARTSLLKALVARDAERSAGSSMGCGWVADSRLKLGAQAGSTWDFSNLNT